MATNGSGVEVVATVGWQWLVSAVVEGSGSLAPGKLALDDAERLEIAARNVRDRIEAARERKAKP